METIPISGNPSGSAALRAMTSKAYDKNEIRFRRRRRLSGFFVERSRSHSDDAAHNGRYTIFSVSFRSFASRALHCPSLATESFCLSGNETSNGAVERQQKPYNKLLLRPAERPLNRNNNKPRVPQTYARATPRYNV